MHQIDTTPGASGPFAPPSGWTGDADAYRALLRERYGRNLAAGQQMGVVALRLPLVTFAGPWSAEALGVAESISERGRAAA